MKKSKGLLLREYFHREQTQLMPFGILPIHALMAERAGFDAFYISGGYATTWLKGQPDVGLMTRTEIIDNARNVVDAVDIPVYCDADTGYGGIQNVRQTVREFINAGVAGVHFEDQVEPKKAGGRAGIAIVSDEEAIGRFRCACKARDDYDPDFMITARTDGYAVGGVEEALRRGLLYCKETDVDVIFYEGVTSWEEARYLLKNTPKRAYCIATPKAGPAPTVKEMTEMGQAISIVQFTLPGTVECWKLLLEVKRSGEMKPMEDYRMKMFAERGTPDFIGAGMDFVKPSYDDVRALEELYLPKEKHRDYENTHN